MSAEKPAPRYETAASIINAAPGPFALFILEGQSPPLACGQFTRSILLQRLSLADDITEATPSGIAYRKAGHTYVIHPQNRTK